MLGAGFFVVAEHYVDEKFGGEGAAGALGIVIGSVVDGRASAVSCCTRVLSSAPSRESAGAQMAPPPEPEPPRRPPPDRPPPPPPDLGRPPNRG